MTVFLLELFVVFVRNAYLTKVRLTPGEVFLLQNFIVFFRFSAPVSARYTEHTPSPAPLKS